MRFVDQSLGKGVTFQNSPRLATHNFNVFASKCGSAGKGAPMIAAYAKAHDVQLWQISSHVLGTISAPTRSLISLRAVETR